MSAVSNNCVWRASYLLVCMLTATASSQITFSNEEAASLVLASRLDTSLRSHQGQRAIRLAVRVLRVCRKQRTVGLAGKGINQSGLWL